MNNNNLEAQAQAPIVIEEPMPLVQEEARGCREDVPVDRSAEAVEPITTNEQSHSEFIAKPMHSDSTPMETDSQDVKPTRDRQPTASVDDAITSMAEATPSGSTSEHADADQSTESESVDAPVSAPAVQESDKAIQDSAQEPTQEPIQEPSREPIQEPISYMPQFKFTTFSSVAPLPTRNITSNFLKSDQNHVLRRRAAAGDRNKDRTSEHKRRRLLPDSSGVVDSERNSVRGGDEDLDEEDTKDADKDDSEDGESEKDESEGAGEGEKQAEESTEAGEANEIGSKIIVIHPGSRFLRIGRASDAYPVVIPHVIARRMRQQSSRISRDAAMDIDVENTETNDSGSNNRRDALNEQGLDLVEQDLKQRMKAAKRRPVPNAKSQVKSFNISSRPEIVLDHNDPYKVEWTDSMQEGDYCIGHKALNLPPKNNPFELFWPIQEGKLNETDYPSPRVVISDLETIWRKVIQDELGIDLKTLKKYHVLLIIPDLYSKLYVTEILGMLLLSMQFRGAMIQQESVCATFGAGVSTACVVDIGAELTKIGCVEDGICISDSRAILKYGGNDITRILTSLVQRTEFPYRDLDLAQTYDWKLMDELKEKWCTLNEADLTVQVYSFHVRKPDRKTEKYQLKVYDEVVLSPMCLFYPDIIRRRITPKPSTLTFAPTSFDETAEESSATAAQQQSRRVTAAATAAASAVSTPAPSAVSAGLLQGGESPKASRERRDEVEPATSQSMTPLLTPLTVAPPVIPFAMAPSVTIATAPWEVAGTIGKDDFSKLVPLDIVVAQSITNCGSEERSKKLYGSIILVGGGGMMPGFDRVLEDRLFQALPATLTTVEKVEVLPSPREMDPRLLTWKGASVLCKLDTAKELWIRPSEWTLLGRKVLKDRLLFVWH